MLVTLFKIREVHFRLLGRNGFHVKAENEREKKISRRHLATSKSCTRKGAAQGARLFFLVLPIISLICGDVSNVAVVTRDRQVRMHRMQVEYIKYHDNISQTFMRNLFLATGSILYLISFALIANVLLS